MLSSYGEVPRIQYGFGVSLMYKRIDLSVFFNGSAKRRIMLEGREGQPGIDPFVRMTATTVT